MAPLGVIGVLKILVLFVAREGLTVSWGVMLAARSMVYRPGMLFRDVAAPPVDGWAM